MSNNKIRSSPSYKAVLVISLSKHLTGESISRVITTDWSKPKAAKYIDQFEIAGFDLDININDFSSTLENLKKELKRRAWNGVLIGWCTRGHIEFTTLFEDVVNICAEEMRVANVERIMFNTGPEDLVEPVLRNFLKGSVAYKLDKEEDGGFCEPQS